VIRTTSFGKTACRCGICSAFASVLGRVCTSDIALLFRGGVIDGIRQCSHFVRDTDLWDIHTPWGVLLGVEVDWLPQDY
jgi:hypothetical protein